MAQQLPSPEHLRAQARHHRELAMRATSPRERKSRTYLADEYDRLADAVERETERPTPEQAAS